MQYENQNSQSKVRGRGVPPLLLAIVLAIGLPPNEISAFPERSTKHRLLSADEGLAIVNATIEHQRFTHGKSDCSHVTYDVYRLAGFPYPYSSSFELYSGTDNFTRVQSPHPGDLIVWPGHVGIVTDPVDHAFYSSVRSGLQAEYYDSPYWKRRGKPRFYRYVIERRANGSSTTVQSTLAGDTPQILKRPVAEKTSSVSSSSNAREIARVTSPDNPSGNSSASVSASRAVGTPANSIVLSGSIVPLRSIMIDTERPQPTREEVADAISELSDATASVLRDDDLSKLRIPVIIYDQLDVERIEIKRDRGWARIRVDQKLLLDGKRVDSKRRSDKLRWELRRTKLGWMAIAPSNRAYVPREVAVRILAAQLAQLTQSDRATNHEDEVQRAEAQLAGLLNELLKNK